MGNVCFFSLTCSSNSADVDDDYVVDGDDDVSDTDDDDEQLLCVQQNESEYITWGDLVAMIAMCQLVHASSCEVRQSIYEMKGFSFECNSRF